MDVLFPRCAGLDISKKDAKVCVRVAGDGGVQETVSTWGAMTDDVLQLRDFLAEQRVQCVVMEATSDYWKPFFYVLEGLDGVEVMLVNARDAKNLPGRKTDVMDAVWLAQLGAHGLVRASFVPPPPIRELRDLTRTRSQFARARGQEVQRLEKVLEEAGIKLSSVATDLMGVSARKMLHAMVQGERDPEVLADMALQRLRAKRSELVRAFKGRFTDHHALLVRVHLDMIDHYAAAIAALTDQIEVVIEPFRAFRSLICTLPGVSTGVADVVTAETGADMSVFATAGHLASWAGVCPGHNESAGKVKSARTRPGDRHLKAALGTAALAIAKHPNASSLGRRYKRISGHRDGMRAIVATERALLVCIWNMARTGACYDDDRHQQPTVVQDHRSKQRAVKQLQALGYNVELTPAAA